MSHDIRTPLNAIIGYSEMMKMGFKTDAEREQAVDSILVSGKALLRLVEHVLDFSKLESGSLEIIPVHTAASKLIGDIVESFRTANTNTALEIRSHAEGLPALLVDPQRIGQLLFNLVSNAVKFTKAGRVEVRAAFDSPGGVSGTLRIEVEDTGCGIGKEDMELIMTPYEKVSAKEARHGGTGLGLALCRRLVKAMGGEIAVASTPGKGSTFTVAIPDVKISTEMTDEGDGGEVVSGGVVSGGVASGGVEELIHPPAHPPARRRILIVDDQKMNLMVLKAMLKKLGDFAVVTAMNGREALCALEAPDAQPFDIVLTDMWMPEMDGEGLVKAIRASGRLKSLPVYVVTADVEMQKRFRDVGFTGILLKPVTVATIGPVLADTAERRS